MVEPEKGAAQRLRTGTQEFEGEETARTSPSGAPMPSEDEGHLEGRRADLGRGATEHPPPRQEGGAASATAAATGATHPSGVEGERTQEGGIEPTQTVEGEQKAEDDDDEAHRKELTERDTTGIAGTYEPS